MALFTWLAMGLAGLDPRPAPADPEKRPVIIVHGIFSTGNTMARVARLLRAEGREVYTPSLTPSSGAVRLEDLAKQLAEYADKNLPGRKFDLVAFSMGGLVSRYYIQRLGGVERVSHFVTMATPHHGTRTAFVMRGPGVLQMRPGSAFLTDLNKGADALRRIKFTSFYTPLDAVIIPARSSEMPQARNVRFWAAMHPSWILERRCIRAVSKALSE